MIIIDKTISMKKNITIIIAITIAMFYQCRKSEYHNFANNEHFLYKDGDTLIYKNDAEKTDSFLVFGSKGGYQHGSGHKDDIDYYEFQEYSLQKINDTIYTLFISRFIRPMQRDNVNSFGIDAGKERYYHFLVYYTDPVQDGDADTLYHELKIENSVYKNVYYYSLENDSSFRKIYYSNSLALRCFLSNFIKYQ